ncbi:MAG: hypothetical protein AAF586_10485 [Planctomycetota bacterium]
MSENRNVPAAPPSVELEPAAWNELIDQINLAEMMIPGRERREHDRVDFDQQVTLYAEFVDADAEGFDPEAPLFTQENAGGDADPSWQRYLVRTRNVSASGLGFFHHVEVEIGRRVLFTAFDTNGRVCTLAGLCARADLIEDGVWDIGVRFDRLIDLGQLVDVDGAPLQKAG